MSTELVKACGGSPARVPGAAKLLHDVGIPLLVDLIDGLFGDTVDEVAQSCKIAGRFVRNAMKCHKRDRKSVDI